MEPDADTKTAAVTGAASGIGRAFCRALARRGFDLLLIDRSATTTKDFADELTREFPGIKAEPCVADLTKPDQLERAAARVRECPSLALLVNGAGFGTLGYFIDTDFARQKDMIDLHVTASVTLCRAALPGMVSRGHGGIINIASINAFTRFPETVTYTATKMFLVAFTECLQAELQKIGARDVKVQALCPGQTRTAFTETEELKGFDPSRVPSFMWMVPETLVEHSLAALSRGSGTFIPLVRNKLFVFVFGNRLLIPILSFLRKLGLLEQVLGLFKKRPRAAPEPDGE